jgi:hypothetical protein
MPVSASGRQAGPARKGFHTKAATHTTVRLYRTNRQAGKIGMEPLFQPAGGRGHSLSHGQGVVRPAVQILGLFLWPTRQPEGGPPPLSQRVGTPDALNGAARRVGSLESPAAVTVRHSRRNGKSYRYRVVSTG